MYKPCMFESQILDQLEILVRSSFFPLEAKDTNTTKHFPDYKWQDANMGAWVEGLRSRFRPQDISQCPLCALATTTGHFWVLAAGRGYRIAEDKDKDSLGIE